MDDYHIENVRYSVVNR